MGHPVSRQSPTVQIWENIVNTMDIFNLNVFEIWFVRNVVKWFLALLWILVISGQKLGDNTKKDMYGKTLLMFIASEFRAI
jgi:hypothetical protein